MTGTASRLEGLRVRAELAAEQVLQEGVGRVTVILSTPRSRALLTAPRRTQEQSLTGLY